MPAAQGRAPGLLPSLPLQSTFRVAFLVETLRGSFDAAFFVDVVGDLHFCVTKPGQVPVAHHLAQAGSMSRSAAS